MNQYQKVYMNQIHSSSLLGQLAQMWKSQMLCDALIRTGNVTTKAHRVVLVAACPMLQSMDNASVGSHLEVRLAADIKQEAVNSFLQYLYEGFMMLSEENCKDVEKVARLLQVDSVTKCCIDFYNCLQKKTGVPVYSNTQYKYSSADLLEFRHVRTTDLQKTLHERMMKRAAADSVRPTSPSGKRQRMQQQRPPSPNIDLAMFGQKADDTLSMTHSYMGNTGNQAAGEPWERVPRIGAIHSQRPSHPKPGVIEIVEDSLEILQTQPPDKDGNKSAPPIIQKSLAISVSSQLNSSQDVHVVNVNDSSSHPTAAGDGPIMSTGRDSITVSPLTVMPGTSSLSSSSASSPLTKDPHKSTMDKDMLDKQTYAKKLQSSLDHQSSTPQRGLFPVSMSPANMSPINQVKKSFAAGSASQAASMTQSHDSPAKRSSTSAGNEMERPQSSDQGKDLGTKNKVDDRSASNSTDMAPDLSIVKVEPTGEAGLDMYVDVPEESMMQAQQREQREHDDESDLELEEASGDWSRDEMSNEAAGGDQNNSWYIGQFKDSPVGKQVPVENPLSHKSMKIKIARSQSLDIEHGQFKDTSARKENMEELDIKDTMEVLSNIHSLNSGNESGSNRSKLLDKSPDLHMPLEQDNFDNNDYFDEDADHRKTIQKGYYPKLDPPYDSHKIEPIGTNKPCAYCELLKRRTKNGWYVYSRFRCSGCMVALCKGMRGCFYKYHQCLKDRKQLN
ncbi:Hypothetical predicted protein [Mytilus galloprovincialis]|uniref:BTB domain-containing protein n=1 Tax=Mytilus galloprovincialis TaxID=29158 RepID=A0A8B6H0E3_MYTGA|nr:Hypothetical predicted protein [Mytilus galloprovincialis]